jgi:mono/diheme cytochrome c family protein
MTKKNLFLLIGVGVILSLSACASARPQALVGQQSGFNSQWAVPAVQTADQLLATPIQNNSNIVPGNMDYGTGGIDSNQGRLNQSNRRSSDWNSNGMSGMNGNGMRHNEQRGGWNGYDNCMGDYGYNNGFAPGQTSGNNIPPATSQDVSFQADAQPILNARCVSCHGGTDGLYLDNYVNVMNGSMGWPVVIPGDPVNSRLIQLVSSGYMPYGGPSLSQAQIQTLVDWVAAGAPNN